MKKKSESEKKTSEHSGNHDYESTDANTPSGGGKLSVFNLNTF